MEKATFGAGCFWQVEAAFRRLRGVKKTTVGYAGGVTKNPTYEDVCTDRTGHAEVVQVEFDPQLVSYRELLDVFWSSHDPTQLNRQGPDIGSQYRSVIFTHGPEQAAVARTSTEEQQEITGNAIVTEINPAPEFHPAEGYHQQYLEKRGLTSCAVGVERVSL
ncbi:MAG: peptide-methionine (S)-S-oxide reductase MsrA [Actinobacteria bacterium]|nr:peptide-methionine (S)-S-oxide reductase MsrA [Actinomycetota bacterium]